MLPMLFGVSIVLFQMGILFMVYLNLVHASRDVGRWLAVHPDSTDAQVQAYVQANLPTNLIPSALSFSFTALDPNEWPWSPRCQVLDASGRCGARATGSAQRVALTYDVAPHVFLPTRITLGWWSTAVPTTLPRYAYNVMVEPR